MVASGLNRLAERIESAASLDAVVRPIDQALHRRLPENGPVGLLRGDWLGHPLHPLLTDLPIGFWTSAFVLDLAGGRRAEPAADALVALGLVTAIPTVAAGAVDWVGLDARDQRTGLVHAACNVTATMLYASSLIARRARRRRAAVVLGIAGAAAASAGGFLGGHLVFGPGDDEADPTAEA